MIKFERLPADIIDRIPDARAVMNESTAVVFAYLFGGLARGFGGPLSDVDIAVYLSPQKKSAEAKLLLFDALTDALGTSELDLVILNSAPISLVGRVLQNRRLLVDKDPFLRHRYESAKLREFFDFRIKESAFFARRFGYGRS